MMTSVSTARLRAFAFALDRGGGLTIVVAGLYFAIAPTHIVDGDNAELVTAATIGGVPHPSGYPLLMLWLRATSWLPGANAAHTAALATAMIGALTIFVLHGACRAWGARPLAASLAVAVFAAAPVILRVSTEAEVFAPNMLIVATVLWLAAAAGPVRGLSRIEILALVAGLGMTNHMTCTLVAPVGILGIVRGVREAQRPVLLALAVGAGALVVGLLPYVYLFVTKTTPISWRTIDSLGDLVHHVLRMDYGGPGAFSPGRDAIAIGDNLRAYVEMLARTWLWLLLPLALAMLGVRIARPAGETRAGWVILAVSFVLAGPLLVLRFNVPPEGVGLAVCHRFYVMSALLLVIPVATGLDWIGAQLVARRAIRVRGWLGGVASIIVLLAAAARSLPRHSPAVEQCVGNMLRSVPQNAVIIVSEDYLYFGALYRQYVEGDRTDVTMVSWGQLLNPGYRARLAARSGITTTIPPDKKASLIVADDVLAKHRPLYIDPAQVNIMKAFPTVPHGILLEVLPRGTAQPPIHDVFVRNKQVFEQFRLGYAMPDPDEDYAAHVHDRYARVWRVIARALAASGAREDAAFALAMAQTLRP
jgi:hypothetical protein